MMRAVSDADVRRIAKDIDEAGFAVIEGCFAAKDIEQTKAFAARALLNCDAGYTHFVGAEPLADTFLHSLAREPDFVELCRRLCAHKVGGRITDATFHQVLRCLTDASPRQHYLVFHYDSYVLTALIPIDIPQRGGELLYVPNRRPLRRFYLHNLIDKLIVDNPVSQLMFRSLHRRKSGVIRYLPLTPGNLYLFWGYCTLHTNEACLPGVARTTALLHFFDPHANSALKKLLRRPPTELSDLGAT